MTEFNIDMDKVLSGVHSFIQKRGYVYPSPEFITSIPEEDKMFDLELSEKTQDFLLNKLSIFTSLLSSASMDEAKYAAQVASLERELEIVKANVFTSSQAIKIEDKRKERDADKRVVEIQEKISVAEMFLKHLTALRISYEKFCFLYSRALTVKSEEMKLQ